MPPRKRATGKVGVPEGNATPANKSPTLPTQSTGTSHASDASAPKSTSPSKPDTPIMSQSPSQPPCQDDKSTEMKTPARKSSTQTISDSPASHDNETSPTQARKTKSWYGSWPRVPKSSASTQIAGENIHGRTLRPRKTADFSKYETRKASDAASVYTTASTTTLANIGENCPNTSEGNGVDQGQPTVVAGQTDGETDTPRPVEGNQAKKGDDVKRPAVTEQPNAAEPVTSNGEAAPATEQGAPSTGDAAQQPSTAYGWLAPLGAPLGWWTRPIAGTTPDTASAETAVEASTEQPKDMDVDAPAEVSTEPHAAAEPTIPAVEEGSQPEQVVVPRSSWFAIWSNSTAPATEAPQPPEGPAGQVEEPTESVETTKEPEDVVMQDALPAEEPAREPTKTAPPKAGSTWAFWSRDTGSKTNGKATIQKQDSDDEEGQLAVMGESSENQPQLQKTKSIDIKGAKPPKELPVQSPETEDSTPRSSWLGTSPAKGSLTAKKSKRLRPQSMDLDQVSIESRDEPPAKPEASKIEPPVKPGSSKTTPALPATKPAQPNLLLPSFKSTYRLKENPSIIKQITQLLLRTQHSSANNHVYLAKEPPKIRKALAIGVHGLFPASYLRPMIGQPTGTSIKFANHAADSIRRWADAHSSPDCEIEKVALEGEGKIGERVENLWKLLLNWIDTIRSADLIILACHSQGVPVTIMLLAKLIELGVIPTTTRIGVCAMAGVSLGPFPDYRSGMGILMGSAAELWEFSNPASEVSKRLESAMKVVLNAGARITFVGSMDDQLVPMESAIYSPAHHPYIYRSVFIDGRLHAPDFIAHLVGFALKLRNLGVTDHGLVRELSLPLAGSLYSGEGHSRLYDERAVYDLAVSHALETTDLPRPPPCEIHKFEGLTQPNPYHLPWIMRGLLEEDFVKTELNDETSELLRQFDDWKPVTKALKDVKYRLEAVRSKL